MFDFQRQHPVAAVSRAFGLIRGNLITIIVFLVVGAQSEEFPFLLWMAGGFAFLLIAGAASWWRFQYKVEDGELHIKSGIFVRKNLYLTKDRIQVIDITSGVIQRLFGLVKVDIQTAGSTSREAAIDAVTLERAKEINRLLRANGHEAEIDTELDENQEQKKVFKLPGKELLIAASTSGSFGIALSILGTLFSQLEPLISESQMFEYAMNVLPSETDLMLVIYVIIIFVIAAWLLSFFSTLFSYGDFRLEVRDEEIVVSRGIFEKKRITIPYNRIQAIHVSEGILRQPLGYSSIRLESAGYGDDKGTGSIVLFPLIRRDKITNLLKEALPGYNKILRGEQPPKRSIRRYIFRSAVIITLITLAIWWMLDLSGWIWLLPVFSVYWGWLKFRDAAVGWDADEVILRSRALAKSTAYLKRNRIQDVTLVESYFQRIRNLCTVRVHVASGDQGKSFSVRDIDVLTGYELLRMFKNKTILSEETEREGEVNLPGWPQPQAAN